MRIKGIIILLVSFILLLAGIITISVIIKNNQTLDYIYISKFPDKREYYVGENLNLNGIVVTGVLKNKKTIPINLEECEISNFDNSISIKGLRIYIKYQDKECNFGLNINELPQLSVGLTKIELIDIPKTIYKVYDTLDTKGGYLLLTFSDNSTQKRALLNKHVYGFPNPNNTPGTYTLQVKYTENGITCETSYDITVTE